MGKKRKHPTIEEILDRPWCYYCEKDFDDQKILVSHQKAKHFKCEKCNRRLNTAGGLSVHMSQVHKESLQQVHNALPNRQGLEHEIFAMEGIPEDVMDQHKQRVVRDYYEKQAEHLAATGNPLPGSGQEHTRKKPKLESIDEMKRRAKEYVAQRHAAKDTGAQGVNGFTHGHQHGAPSLTPGQPFAASYSSGSPVPPTGAYAAPNRTEGQSTYGLPDRPTPAPQDPRLRAQRQAPVSNADVDDLIASATKRPTQGQDTSGSAKADKKAKKDGKDKVAKPTAMLYDDDETTPEERLAQITKYSYNISAKKPETVLAEADRAAVSGAVDEQAAQDS